MFGLWSPARSDLPCDGPNIRSHDAPRADTRPTAGERRQRTKRLRRGPQLAGLRLRAGTPRGIRRWALRTRWAQSRDRASDSDGAMRASTRDPAPSPAPRSSGPPRRPTQEAKEPSCSPAYCYLATMPNLASFTEAPRPHPRRRSSQRSGFSCGRGIQQAAAAKQPARNSHSSRSRRGCYTSVTQRRLPAEIVDK